MHVTLSGAIIDGIPRPFVVGAGEVTSPLCFSISLSIASPRVFHSAFSPGSNSYAPQYWCHRCHFLRFRLPDQTLLRKPLPAPCPPAPASNHRDIIFGTTRFSYLSFLPLRGDTLSSGDINHPLPRPSPLTRAFISLRPPPPRRASNPNHSLVITPLAPQLVATRPIPPT